MKVFISWGVQDSLSHEGAKLLQTWLESTLPGLKCFVSSHNIAGGAMWLPELFKQMATADAGVCCLTHDSANRDWMLFEAGAVAQRTGTDRFTRLIPLLFETVAVGYPFLAFQSRQLDQSSEEKSKEALFAIVKQFNEIGGEGQHQYDAIALEKQFARCWPEFWIPYGELRKKFGLTPGPGVNGVTNVSDFSSDIRAALMEIAGSLADIRSAIPVSKATPAIPAKALPPVEAVTAVFAAVGNCPSCEEPFSTEMPDRVGQTRTFKCSKCGHIVYVHLLSGREILIRAVDPAKLIRSPNKWHNYLAKTQAWIEPDLLGELANAAAEVSAIIGQTRRITGSELFQQMCIKMATDEKSSVSRTTIRRFTKLLYEGGLFLFNTGDDAAPVATAQSGSAFDKKSIVRAYARSIARRLLREFSIGPGEALELGEFLFPSDEDSGRSALLEALAGKSSEEGLTDGEIGPS